MSQEIKEAILDCADYYGVVLNPKVLTMYCADLCDLNPKIIISAYIQWRKDPKNTRMPLPAQIRATINPDLDDRKLSIEISRQIENAISKHGWNWEDGYFSPNGVYWESNNKIFFSFKEALLEELGPIGFAVITRMGWLNLRNKANEMEPGTFHAQLRDTIDSTIYLERSGVNLAKLEFPKKNNELNSIGANILNLLNFDKKT